MDPIEPYYFEKKEEIIGGVKIPPITEDYVDNYPSVVDRFFTRYYYIKPGNEDEHYLVLFHSNRVCLIGLAPGHVALQRGIKNITFNVGNIDRSLNQVRGKGKKGGMILQEDSTLAIVTDVEDYNYKVPSCVKGKLIEVNERVLSRPEILSEEGNGYLAIVLPKPENCEHIKASLLTHEEYLVRRKQ